MDSVEQLRVRIDLLLPHLPAPSLLLYLTHRGLAMTHASPKVNEGLGFAKDVKAAPAEASPQIKNEMKYYMYIYR